MSTCEDKADVCFVQIDSLAHIAAVDKIQRLAYNPRYWEDRDAFLAMSTSYAKGARLLLVGGAPVGYVFAYPCVDGMVMPLNPRQVTKSEHSNCMYIHDLAVHPKFRGRGLGGRLLEQVDLMTVAEAYDMQTLTSVQGSDAFWIRKGFAAVMTVEYAGSPANYMRRCGLLNALPPRMRSTSGSR